METKTFYADPRKVKAKLIGSCVLFCVGAAILAAPFYSGLPFGPSDWAKFFVFSGLLSAFEVFAFLSYLPYANRSKPILIIDSDGIEVTEPMTYAVRVPWSEIETTHLKWDKQGLLRVVQYLTVQVSHPDGFVNNSRFWWRTFVQRRNAAHWGSPVFVLGDILETPVEEVQLIVENHLYDRRKIRESYEIVPRADTPDAVPLRIAIR